MPALVFAVSLLLISRVHAESVFSDASPWSFTDRLSDVLTQEQADIINKSPEMDAAAMTMNDIINAPDYNGDVTLIWLDKIYTDFCRIANANISRERIWKEVLKAEHAMHEGRFQIQMFKHLWEVQREQAKREKEEADRYFAQVLEHFDAVTKVQDELMEKVLARQQLLNASVT